jgi:hypothetical protein
MDGKYRQKLLVFVFLFLITLLLLALGFSKQEINSNKSIVRLGNPLLADGKTDRALNVWDLQVFNGKIYLGGGSSVENAGPINVWAYNTETQSFEKEYTVDEEAIEHFKVFDKELYIPAADPHSSDTNKFYRKEADGNWHKYSSKDVTLAHVRDLIKTNSGDILLVGNSRNPQDSSQPGTAVTTDNGITFQGAGIDKIPVINNEPILFFNWFFSVFSYQNKIYAPTSLLKNKVDLPGAIAVYNRNRKKFEINYSLSNLNFIPKNLNFSSDRPIINRIWNTVEYHGSLIYAVRSYAISPSNDQQDYMNSLGIFYKKTLKSSPLFIQFPDQKSLGEDLLLVDNQLYALANKKQNKTFIVYVYKLNQSNTYLHWKKIVHFKSKNRVRSFEYLNSVFYFGLGHDYQEEVGDSGAILKYKI